MIRSFNCRNTLILVILSKRFSFQQDCRAFSDCSRPTRKPLPALWPHTRHPGGGACGRFAALYSFEGFPIFWTVFGRRKAVSWLNDLRNGTLKILANHTPSHRGTPGWGAHVFPGLSAEFDYIGLILKVGGSNPPPAANLTASIQGSFSAIAQFLEFLIVQGNAEKSG